MSVCGDDHQRQGSTGRDFLRRVWLYCLHARGTIMVEGVGRREVGMLPSRPKRALGHPVMHKAATNVIIAWAYTEVFYFCPDSVCPGSRSHGWKRRKKEDEKEYGRNPRPSCRLKSRVRAPMLRRMDVAVSEWFGSLGWRAYLSGVWHLGVKVCVPGLLGLELNG